MPAFSGLGLPHWRPEARAAITGLSSHSDRRHVARAALEAMAYQLRDALEAMREEAGGPLQALHADGGPTANTQLMQFTADITGVELRVASSPDCSPLGAAFVGMLGRKWCTSFADLAALPRDETVFRPAMPATEVERRCAGWRRAVAQVMAGVG